MARKKATEGSEIKFSKEQILESKKYRKERDLLTVLLEDDKEYLFEDIETLIKNYKEMEV
ncbi:hypothetical protein JHD53_05080 [Peptacetobacter hiranonis]|uniref:hypothetical protein n=1 Tax=Peptacetobacter hiranonis TaxID=89152 RepID=UPI0019179257|nr:hypothetical protein [Peptacetobacter hiranonis]QQQ87454.1 hypothetical protein JHD53_05080 [Peptacetobacter hiranonis]